MSKLKKLNEIYAKIPVIECKGLCHESCSIVPAAKIEIKRARGRMGKNPFNPVLAMKRLSANNTQIPACDALKDGRCSIYTARPAICRLYGVAEGLECPFGCKPKQFISKHEAYDIVREVEAL
jgi:Fe-S-cluster containining protein